MSEQHADFRRGLYFILLSALGFAFMNLMIRLAGDLPSMEKSFFRNLVALLVAGLSFFHRPPKVGRLGAANWGLLVLRSSAGLVGIICNYYALSHLRLADASVLNKLSPFFVLIFSAVLLKERIHWKQLAFICLAFGGVLLVSRPGGALLPPLPLFMGILGGVMAGFAYTMVRLLSLRAVPGNFIVFFFSLFSTLALLPVMLFDYHPMDAWQFCCLLLAGIGASLGQFGITYAYRYAPAREISIYDYSSIAFTALLALLVLHELPPLQSFFGYLIIFAASYGNFAYKRRLSKEAQYG